MQTTVPFFISRGRYKRVSFPAPIPIFEQLPTKEDFEIATSQIDFEFSPSIVIDLGILVVRLAYGEKVQKYYIVNEFSQQEQWCFYVFDEEENYESAIETIKALAQKEKQYVESLLKKLDRALMVP